MPATDTRRSFTFGIAFISLLSALGLYTVSAGYTQRAFSPQPSFPAGTVGAALPMATDVDLLAGISLSRLLTDGDRAYLRDNLEFLHDRLPQWWQHVVAAKPFALSVDERLGAQGRAATTRCCDTEAIITFGFHFEQMSASDDPASQTPEARRIRFLAVLIHEATHVRDLRAGRFSIPRDYKTCVDAERSGLTRQLEFEQDLTQVQIGTDPATNEMYAARLRQVIAAESTALRSRETWNQYCGQWLGG